MYLLNDIKRPRLKTFEDLTQGDLSMDKDKRDFKKDNELSKDYNDIQKDIINYFLEDLEEENGRESPNRTRFFSA